mmetsp:Transcript_75626/g.67841  ORF Transcript_75626/g.67841 Transcript_75626/m.67841 type:complete len:370 (-) Transcript_75626:88-1197(-)
MAAPDEGLVKKCINVFYNGNKINYKSLAIASSALVIGGYTIKTLVSKGRNTRARMKLAKIYYKTHANTLQYINLLLRVHLPLSINSVLIISHLRYLKQKGDKLDYNDIKYGYIYGIINFILSAFVIERLVDTYLYKSFSDDIVIKIFEKFILSPAESQLISEMTYINEILHIHLGKGVENIKDLENIIWEYLGPIDEAVDYKDFKDMITYVQNIKDKFIREQKHFTLERYLIKRAIDMFDFRVVARYKIWSKVKGKHTNELTVLLNVAAQIIVYLIRLFSKMTFSQIWYLLILELSGNHDLLNQYLYSLMSREPLYLMIGFPFFILRFSPIKLIRADILSGALKNWIVNNIKEITTKLFGSKGFIQKRE